MVGILVIFTSMIVGWSYQDEDIVGEKYPCQNTKFIPKIILNSKLKRTVCCFIILNIFIERQEYLTSNLFVLFKPIINSKLKVIKTTNSQPTHKGGKLVN